MSGAPTPRMIRRAVETDGAAIWRILEPTIRAGETYALDRDMSRAEATSAIADT